MINEHDITDIKNRISKVQGISDYSKVSIEEMDWLVARAERAKELEKDLEEMLWRNDNEDYDEDGF